MGSLMTATVDIARPVSEVFSYLLDFERNMPEWADDVEYCRKTTEGPVGPGTTFVLGQRRFGKARPSTVRIVDVDPGHRIGAQAKVGPLLLEMDFVVEQVPQGAQVTITGNGKLPGPLNFLAPVGARQGRRVWERRLARLKEMLER